MTTQSKSVLMPFLIIAGLVFSVALAWKFLGSNDNTAEQVESQSEVVADKGLVKNEIVLKADNTPKEIKIVSYSKPAEETREITDEQMAEIEMKSKYFMKFAMRYSEPKSAIDGLRSLRLQEETERANALIKFIEEQFPNTEIPADLLEF